MNKLGFAIKLASQGAGNAIECNKGQWTNKVVDIREYLKLFDGLQGTDNIVTFMSFDEEGCFLTQFRAISGRVGDFLSGWIYIPNTIDATGEEIMSAYNYVQNILSQSNLSGLKDDIESFFSKEYPLKEVVAKYVASRGELYGVRLLDCYGHYTLKEIIGEHRYQPYYSDYKAVFLLNYEEVKITKEAVKSFKDLTKKEIVRTSILVPPNNASLQALGSGTKIHLMDGSDFNQSLLVNVGSKVPLYLSRIGFENMKFEVTVSSERQNIDLSNVKITWMKKISASMFTVITGNKAPRDLRISVNEIDVTFREVLLSEEDCRRALVKISATDYETFEQRRNLLNDDLKITLRREVKSTKTRIELSNGKTADMTIESKYLPSNSPLTGYEYDEYSGGKILRLSSWFVWKQRLWGFLGGLGVLALIVLFLIIDTWIDNGCPMPWDEKKVPPTEAFTIDQSEGQESQNLEDNSNVFESVTLDDAIKYLDEKNVWSKSEMDKYPDLQGLFEDMNNFNLLKLLNEWSIKLSSSQSFKKVCESVNKTYTNGWNPRQAPHNPTYNKHDNEKIRLQNYIDWLDCDQTPPVTNTGGGLPSGNGRGKTGANAGKSGSNAGKGAGSANAGKSGQGNKGKKDIFD